VAYLDRQLSEYKVSTPLMNRIVDDEINSQQIHDAPAQAVKNSNYQLAKQVADAKMELIKALAQFPVTAFWLTDKVGQNNDRLEQDRLDSLASDLALSVAEINQSFLEHFRFFQNDNIGNVVHINCKQRLIFQVQQLPFSFEELVKLTDVIVYGIKIGGLLEQELNYSTIKPAKVIDKRLKAAESPAKIHALENFRIAAKVQYPDAFLYLSGADRISHLTQLIFAEQRWLTARQDLVMANNKLVAFIVNQYRGSFLDFNDLVQEGHAGLLKAVDRFDYRLGFQFSTYAGYWIRQAISRSLSRSERSVRIPCEQIANINRVFRTKDKLVAQTGKDASVQDIAEHTQLSCDDINTILAFSQAAISLDGTEDEDSERTFAPVDFLEQQTFTHAIDEIAEVELGALISDALDLLNPREAQVVRCHFGVQSGSEMTLQEIGDELNLTRERVRQIQVIALKKIKLNYGQQLINFLK
jgi:RNA polymerase sigma factor (sigma-70 family)